MKSPISQAFKVIDPRNIKKKLDDRAIVQNFATSTNLVFFGHVNQDDEDQKVVHGITVSRTHRDQYYLIGSVDEYDVVFVERSDSVLQVNQRKAKHARRRWHIFQFDLKTPIDHPMIFISNQKNEESYRDLIAIKYPNLYPTSLSSWSGHSLDFAKNHHIFSAPTYFTYVDQLLPPDVTDLIAKHFGHFAVEIAGNSLLIYSEGARLSAGLLKTMLQNGLWLAQRIDARSRELQAG